MEFREPLRDASNMQSEFTNVEQFILSQLECPVCTQYMRPPITFCANGHNICNICKQRVQRCPTCRQQLLNARNLTLEKLATEVNYSCVYRNYGCREIYKLDLIGGHQEKCQYIPQACPVNKLYLGTCTWSGISSKMNAHLKQVHSDICMVYYGPGKYHSRGPFPLISVTPAKKLSKLIFAHNELFFSCSEIQNGVFYSVLQYIGPADNAVKYRYKLEFFNKERTENLAVTLLVRSLDEDLSEVHNSGNCVKLYPEQFNRFANESNELVFRMEILTV